MHQPFNQEYLVYSFLSSVQPLELTLEIPCRVHICNVVQDVVLHELADKPARLKMKYLPLLVRLVLRLRLLKDWATVVLDVEQIFHLRLPGLKVQTIE